VLDGLQIFLVTQLEYEKGYDVFEELRPKYIVLFDPDVQSIRKVEVHNSDMLNNYSII